MPQPLHSNDLGRAALLALVALAPLQAGARPSAAGDSPAIELPPGAAADAVAAVAADQVPAGSLVPWPGPGSPHWSQRAPWVRWVRTVRAASAEARVPGPGTAHARAELALLAATQGRHESAWDHLSAAGSDPALVAAVLPALLPGVPGAAPGTGGLPAPLPNGALLAPLVPPRPSETGERFPARRRMAVRGLVVGEASIALAVQLEPDGVQIDLEHLSGGPCHVLVRIPEAPGLETRLEYVDWIRQDDVGVPRRVELVPGGEPVSLWARALPAGNDLPGTLPARLPAQIEHAGIAVEIDPRDSARARLEQLGDALAELLRVPSAQVEPGPRAPTEAIAPLVIRLPASPRREQRIGLLLDLAERWQLQGR